MLKVMLVNGSPHEKGCTYTALSELTNTFAKDNVQDDSKTGRHYGCTGSD